MKPSRIWLFVALSALCLALMGCGAGDGTQPQTGDYGGPPTKAPPGAGG